MAKAILACVLAAAGIYAALALWVFWIQDRLVYPAPRGGHRDPEDAGVSDAEPFEVRSGEHALHGWILWPRVSERRSLPALLVFHGNAENVTLDAAWLDGLRRLGLAVAAIDYRGYGLSEGRPSEDGLIADGLAAFAALRARPEIDPDRIVVLGASLGSGVAVAVAAREPVAGVILQSAYASLRAIAKREFRWLPSFLLRSPFDSLARVRSVRAPVVFIHGTDDALIPIGEGRALAAATPRVAGFHAVERAGHNDVASVAGSSYDGWVGSFARGVRAER